MRSARLTLTIWAFCLLFIGCSSGVLVSAPEPVTLRFAYRTQTMEITELLDGFHEQYPHITVEVVEAERWGNDLRFQIEQGTVDAFRESRQALGYADDGLIRPLDDMQLADWADIRDDYYTGTWDALSAAGQQWGIPAGLDMMVTFVNLDEAEALGLALPDTESDWSSFAFLELASAMNYPEGLPHNPSQSLFGFCTHPEEMDPFVFVYLNGGAIVDDLNDPSVPTLDMPATVEAITWYTDLFTRYNVAPDPTFIDRTYRQGGIYEAQARGHCGLWLGLYSNRGGLDTPSESALRWAMLPLPQEQPDLGLADFQGYFVTQNSQHPEEALLLLRYLSNHWQAAGYHLPPRHSLVSDAAYEQAVGQDVAAQAQAFSDQMIVVPAQFSPELEAVGGAVIRVIYEHLNQGTPIELLLEEAQQQVKQRF